MNKLWVRFSFTFSVVVLIAVLIVVLTSITIRQFDNEREESLAKSLQKNSGLVEQLAIYYQTHQNWAGVEMMLLGAQALNSKDDFTFVLTDGQGRVIYHPPTLNYSPSKNEADLMLPILVDRQTVAFLGVVPSQDKSHTILDLRRRGDILLSIAVAIGIGGIAFGVIMSRTLTAPLNNLTQAAKAIAAHNLSQRVEERGSDEMIAVAHSFNKMAAALEQAEQLRRNLLADVAHELRAPLSIIQGNLRAILDEVYPLDQAEMARLYEHTRSLSHLVDDLHELAQAEARQLPLHLQETDLAQLIRITAEGFGPGADEKQVTLETDLTVKSLLLKVDSGRITQVLQNLLANALRHTPAGGKITIRLHASPETIYLAVADTGEGIPPEHLPHIFDRFYRTDPARSRDRGGAGLGLAIARAIVEAHGGQIIVTSFGVPGQGSTFTVQLPTKQIRDG